MEYPKKYTISILVENKQQEEVLFNSFIQDKSIEGVGKVCAISKDDLFEEKRLFYKCFSKTAVSKLKEADYFNENNSLENFQSEIREWIDDLIDEQMERKK